MTDRVVRGFVFIAALATLFLATDSQRIWADTQILGAWVQIETQYYFALIALLLPMAFLLNPLLKRAGALARLPDIALATVTLGVCAYLFATADASLEEGWEFSAPFLPTLCALCLWILVMEALRRVGGWPLFVIAGLFSVMPMVADQLPESVAGLTSTWQETASYHVFSIESIFGLPFRAFADLVIGFVVFGVALQFTGGGRFFLDLAFALLGGVRGGAAKVAIVSSGLMGSMSGSVVTNVLTTGQMTIPAMKRAGMKAEVAGGIEACASTGGVLLPPIMGSTAFVMATVLEVPYFEVAAAAALPALLYFTALFLQIDAYAARAGLKGSDRSELPEVGKTLKQGWHYCGAFVVLIVLLVVLQREAVAPYYATAALLVLNQISRHTRLTLQQTRELVEATGRLLIELAVILAGVGLIVGSLSVTGLGGTLVNDLLFIAGDSVALLLLMGAVTSFILGIGMTVTAAYIFLAIILAPALTAASLDPMSVHLFILYWAMLSFITPPVALGAFAAASIAHADPLKTGLASMRLGSVIYFLPFIFVLDPRFVLAGSALGALSVFSEALAGVVILVGGLQGYLPWLGVIHSLWSRTLLTLAGLAIALPSLEVVQQGLDNGLLWIAAIVTLLLAAAAEWMTRRVMQPVDAA